MEEDQKAGQGSRKQRAEAAGERELNTNLMPVTARGEATRRRILDAAEVVFGAKGYYEASVTEITQRAQVAQGTFYLYFHSKREIFLQLVEDLGERLREAIRAATQQSRGRMAIERDGFEAFFAFARAHRQLYRIVQEADRVDQPTYQEYYARIARGYTRGLSAAMEAGEIRQMDPEALTYALMGIAHFTALRWLIWPESDESAEATSAPNGVIPGQHGSAAQEDAPQLPERVFETLLEFLARGLTPEG